MSKPRRRGYVLIPDEIMERTDLSGAHKMVIGVLARLQGEKGMCYPGYEYLAKACGLSRRHVVRVVNDLALRGEIVRLRHKRGEPNTYSVPWATERARRKMWAEKRRPKAS